MDETTAQCLVALNNEFYAQAALSFSATRHASWPGWEPLISCLTENVPTTYRMRCEKDACARPTAPIKPIPVLDIACGNMRFEAYLEEKLPTWPFDFHAVDSCASFELRQTTLDVTFQQLDVLKHLMSGTLEDKLQSPRCALVACLAFLHHVPTQELRMQLLKAMLNQVEQGGLMAVSLWTFADDTGFAARAEKSTAQATTALQLENLDSGDYLLGWQNNNHLWRYCHSFDNDEIDDLATCLEPHASAIRRFQADGRTNRMNTYLVFRRT